MKMSLQKIVEATVDYYLGKANLPREVAVHRVKLLAANFNERSIKTSIAFFQTLFPSIKRINFSSDTNPSELDTSKTGIFYLSNHISNMDSFVLATQMFKNGFPYPDFAAGENLFKGVFGSLLRSWGAFYIRRGLMRKSELLDYLDLLTSYFHANIDQGKPNAFFPEGTRTRDGFLKNGLGKGLVLSMLNAFSDVAGCDNPSVEDFWIVPEGLAYKRVPEMAYFAKNKSSRRQKTNLVFEYVRFGHSLDRAYMHIGKPISLKQNFSDGDVSDSRKVNEFVAYLRQEIARTIPVLPSDVILYSVNALSDEGLGKAVDYNALDKKTRELGDKLKDKGLNVNNLSFNYLWTIGELLQEPKKRRIISREGSEIFVEKPVVVQYHANKVQSLLDSQ